MSYLFTYNNRHSESRFYRDEESIQQNLFEILRFTQNDSTLYVLFLKRLLPVAIFFTLTLTACTEAQEFTEKDVEICKSTFQLSVNTCASVQAVSVKVKNNATGKSLFKKRTYKGLSF